MMAACHGGLAKAAVVAEGTGSVTASMMDQAAHLGVALVALTDDPAEVQRLRGLGVMTGLLGEEPAILAERISDAVTQLAGKVTSSRSLRSSAIADTGAELSLEPMRPMPSEEEGERGELLAVWGPIGSPGRTLVAVNIAAELAAEGKSVLLVDADTYGASVAGVLGLLDESAGIAQACRLADQGNLDGDALRRIAAPVFLKSGQLRVLTGITRADRWIELRGNSLSTVLTTARRIADVVVVDAGFCLEADEELSFDTLAPRRNAATLRSLEMADRIFAIGSADAVGLPRIVRALSELVEAVPHASPTVLLNKVRASAVGRSPESQLREAWERYASAFPLGGFLPADHASCDAALLSGSVLLETAPNSPLRTALARLVCADVQENRRSSVFSTRAMSLLKR
jgi:Mrp family chromosome partitioning ATPase